MICSSNLYTFSHWISQFGSLTESHTGRQGWWRSRQVTAQSVTEDNMSQEEFEGGRNRLWHMQNFKYSFFLTVVQWVPHFVAMLHAQNFALINLNQLNSQFFPPDKSSWSDFGLTRSTRGRCQQESRSLGKHYLLNIKSWEDWRTLCIMEMTLL